MRPRRQRIVEGGREAHALDRRLRDAGDGAGRIDPDEIEQRRQDVDGVHVLVTCAPLGPDAGRPVEDERIGHAPFVGVALESLQRRVAGPGPAPRVVVVGLGCAEVVDPSQVLLEALGDEVEEVLLVERPLRTALGRCAVVAHDDDDGVLGLTELLNEVEDAGDLGVGVGEEAGVDLHQPSGQTLLVVAQRVPGRDPRGALGELGALGQEARCQSDGRTPPLASGPIPCRSRPR